MCLCVAARHVPVLPHLTQAGREADGGDGRKVQQAEHGQWVCLQQEQQLQVEAQSIRAGRIWGLGGSDVTASSENSYQANLVAKR